MKKTLILMLTIISALMIAACGGGGNQTIEFQGITMEIPSDWKVEESTLSDDYAIYEKSSKNGHEYKLLLTDNFGLMEDGTYDLEAAGAFFKEVTEDNASYSDPSDPVAGKFAGKYDMHTIECKYNMTGISKDGAKEVSYPCKLIRIYMGDHDVVMQFSTVDADFEAFDTAVSEASCK